VLWHKTNVWLSWLTREQWDAISERIVVREITAQAACKGFRTTIASLKIHDIAYCSVSL